MVSFIIPSYNRNSYLVQLLESILAQDYKDIEIIVVDDNSSDQTEETMTDYVKKHAFIEYHKNMQNMGCGYNRGLGVNKSKGEYVVFADDDDYYTNNSFLSRGVQMLTEYPTLAFVAANAKIKIENTGEISDDRQGVSGYVDQKDYFAKFNLEYGRPLSTFPTIFKREALERAEIAQMTMVNDASIYLRSLLYGDVYIMEDIVGIYRIHNSNITKSLSSDFIIQNLDEKKYVYDKALKSGVVNNSGWLQKHFIVTISYYFRSSKTNFSDMVKLIKWGQANGIANAKAVVTKYYILGKGKHFYASIKR